MGVRGRQIERDVGVGLRKCGQPREQPQAREARRGVDIKAVAHALAQVVARRADGLQRATDTREVLLARGAQAHAMRAAFEQAHAQLRFEPRDLMADRGSGEMQLGGSERKAAAAGHGLEGLEVHEGRNGGHGGNPHVR